MSIEKIEQELRDGLDGVTPGPWWPGHLADDSSSCNCTSILAENGRMGSIAQITVDNGLRIEDGGNDGPPIEEAKCNLRHIARCDPDTIRALLDEVSRLREALKPFGRENDLPPNLPDETRLTITFAGQQVAHATFGDFRRARALSEREGQE